MGIKKLRFISSRNYTTHSWKYEDMHLRSLSGTLCSSKGKCHFTWDTSCGNRSNFGLIMKKISKLQVVKTETGSRGFLFPMMG
jgi:hypothetical protein